MKKIIFLFAVVITFLLFAPADSFACSCLAPSPNTPLKKQVETARNQAKAVFSGKVVEIQEDSKTYYVKVKFKVEKVWKSNLPKTIIIQTGRGGGDCGYRFDVGESYLVYAFGGENGEQLGTGICSRTTNIAAAQGDLKILGNRKLPKNKKPHRKSART